MTGERKGMNEGGGIIESGLIAWMERRKKNETAPITE